MGKKRKFWRTIFRRGSIKPVSLVPDDQGKAILLRRGHPDTCSRSVAEGKLSGMARALGFLSRVCVSATIRNHVRCVCWRTGMGAVPLTRFVAGHPTR